VSSHSPIPSPPPELVEQWRATPEYTDLSEKLFLVTLTTKKLQDIATAAARWGADQELEACVEWLDRNSPVIGGFHLRIDRRPEPPRLKEQALDALREAESTGCLYVNGRGDTIRRALEALDD
jgi:hypothetical protein